MTDFADLTNAYQNDPAAALKLIDGLEPQQRLDLVLNNLEAGKRANRLADEKATNLPAAYRKVPVRWTAFENLCTFERGMLAFHMRDHVAFEAEGGTYIRNTLAFLVWKAAETPAV